MQLARYGARSMIRVVATTVRNSIISRSELSPHLPSALSSQSRYLASNAPGDAPTGPTPQLKSWESGARMVKNIHVENQYLEHIREVHDPSMHLKTIEDELKGTIGQALGKQGQKILAGMRLMEQERQAYLKLVEDAKGHDSAAVYEAAKKYNEQRELTVKSRWELIVHRQAAGFTVGNHSFVLEKFPIPEKLPEEPVTEEDDSTEKPKKKIFGDQLDWWQRVGRWK